MIDLNSTLNVSYLEISYNEQLRSLDTTFICGLSSFARVSFKGCRYLTEIDYKPLQHLIDQGLELYLPNGTRVPRSTIQITECKCDCCMM